MHARLSSAFTFIPYAIVYIVINISCRFLIKSRNKVVIYLKKNLLKCLLKRACFYITFKKFSEMTPKYPLKRPEFS